MTPEEIGRRLLGPALVARLERHLAPPLTEDLCRLVAAVAAQERAACLEACCWYCRTGVEYDPATRLHRCAQNAGGTAGTRCDAEAIRARGAAP